MDGGSMRRSMDSTRRGSAASSVLVAHLPEEDEVVSFAGKAAGDGDAVEEKQRHDILADLTKLQREIDALRVQSGKGG